MQSKADDIRVINIAPFAIGAVWPFAAPHLARGLGADTETTFSAIADALADGTSQLWVITTGDDITGAFLTAIHDDAAGRVVHVSTLGGAGIDKAATLIDDAMGEFAKSVECVRVRFCGRQGWARWLPEYDITGQMQNHQIYERAVR